MTPENIVTNGEIAQNKQFPLLPQCYQLFSLMILLKTLWQKGKKLLINVLGILFYFDLIVWIVLILSHMQQICSRRLWKHIDKNIENPYK